MYQDDYNYSNYQPTYHAPPQEPPQEKKKRAGLSGIRLTALCLVCALLGGCVSGGLFALLYGPGSQDGEAGEKDGASSVQVSDREDISLNETSVPAGEEMSVSQIYDAYAGSVVSINVSTASGIGAGTGFVISEDGYILTCYHVVDGYTAISCNFIDTTSYEATYVGGDADSDVAILKIEASGLTPVVLGDSTLLRVGDRVTTIGNALGTLANTTTTGVVSARDRAVEMGDGVVMNVLQTDCTVNSGNSGGPLFNSYGEVVGIVNAKYSSGSSFYSPSATIEGIGFAIPMEDVFAIMDDLMTYGYITGKPRLGITISTVSSVTAQQYPNDYVVGAIIQSVEEGSCAQIGGLQAGDIITAVNGKEITTYEEVIEAKNLLRAGDIMEFTVFRDGSYYTIAVTLDEDVPEPAAGTPQEETPPPSNENNGGEGGSGNPFEEEGSGNGYFPFFPFNPFSFFW